MTKSDILAADIAKRNEEMKQDLMVLRFKTSPRVIRAQLKEVVGPPALMKGMIEMMSPLNEHVKEKVNAVKDTAVSNLKDSMDAVKDTLGHAKDVATEGLDSAVHSVKNRVGTTTSGIRHAVRDGTYSARATIAENPWTTTLLATGAALAVTGVVMAVNAAKPKAGYDRYEALDRFADDGNPNVYEGSGFVDNYQQYADSRVSRNFGRVLKDQPLLVGSAALLVGAAIGALLPRSNYENQMVGEASDRFVSQTKARIQETVSDVKDRAVEQVEEMKKAAKEAGQEVRRTLVDSVAAL